MDSDAVDRVRGREDVGLERLDLGRHGQHDHQSRDDDQGAGDDGQRRGESGEW